MSYGIPKAWYSHVITCHRPEYGSDHNPAHSGDHSEEEMTTGDDAQDNTNMDHSASGGSGDESYDPICEHFEESESISIPMPSETPPFISDEKIPGRLLKLRYQYMLSHAAAGEVVELVQTVCNNMLQECFLKFCS